MKKPIFENEQEAINFISEICNYGFYGFAVEKHILEIIKQKGYIKKSALERAEEMWSEYQQKLLERKNASMSWDHWYEGKLADVLYQAIQELKTKLEDK